MSTAAAAAFAPPPAAAAPAAPGAAPAAPPAAAPAGAPAAPAANANWYDGFDNADVKTWTAAKGFKDPAAVAESAYNLEKLIGHERAGRTLVMPKDDASPEELAAFNAKLGVPATPDGYTLPLPEGYDPKMKATLQGWMHKAGIPPRAANELTKEFFAFSETQQAEALKHLETTSDQAFAGVTTEWGKDAEANLELGRRFASQVLPEKVKLDDGTELDRQQFIQTIMDRTGATAAITKLFAEAGKGMGEHKMRTNGEAPNTGGMSPSGAQAKIKSLMQDKVWAAAYVAGDKNKLAEMTQLNAIAYPV